MKNNIENNKLIAEFMQHDWDMEVNNELCILDTSFEKVERKLQYSDWNSLMPVVEKIESLGYDTEIVCRQDDGGHCFYINDSKVFSSQMGSKKEAVYSATIEFIKWYNKTANEKPTDLQQQNRDLGQSTII